VLVLQTSVEEWPGPAEGRMRRVATLCAHRWARLLGIPALVGARGTPTPAAHRATMLELAMSNARIGTFEWEIATGKLTWDERTCELFGIRPVDFDGRVETFFRAVHPDDVPLVEARLEESRRTGTYEVTFHIVRRDGVLRLLEAEARVLFDGAGEAQRMVGVTQDRTEEHERETRRQARADFTVRFTRGLSAALSTEDIIRTVAETALPELGGSSLAVYLSDEQGVARFAGARGFDPDALAALRRATRTADSPLLDGLRSGQPYFLESRSQFLSTFPDERFTPVDDRQAWAVLPLTAGDEQIGACAIGYDSPRTFSADDRTVLTAAAGALAQALARARLFDSRRAYLTELQQLMLPGELPGLHGLEVAARYRPGSEGLDVGGDWYDVLRHSEDRCALVIGDVQGHSARAAAVMGQLRTAMHAHAAEGHPVRDLMSRANETLCTLETDLFATCCIVEIDQAARRLHVVRAGHALPLLLEADGQAAEVDARGGLPLGVLPAQEYPLTTTGLPGGCTLLLYTDGLVERPGTEYTEAVDRLAERLAWWAGTQNAGGGGGPLDLESVADRLVTPVAARPHHDDVALLLLRCARDGGDE
jgi:PAS domain S-box-containing protein